MKKEPTLRPARPQITMAAVLWMLTGLSAVFAVAAAADLHPLAILGSFIFFTGLALSGIALLESGRRR